jgi:hypothetical protein
MGRWNANVLKRQRRRKKRYCSSRGCVLRGGSVDRVWFGAAFSIRAQVR